MIFTATQVARSQTASQEFKAYKAENLAPAVVSETRVFAIPTTVVSVARRHIAKLSIEGLFHMII
jgi:hypothetical protein